MLNIPITNTIVTGFGIEDLFCAYLAKALWIIATASYIAMQL